MGLFVELGCMYSKVRLAPLLTMDAIEPTQAIAAALARVQHELDYRVPKQLLHAINDARLLWLGLRRTEPSPLSPPPPAGTWEVRVLPCAQPCDVPDLELIIHPDTRIVVGTSWTTPQDGPHASFKHLLAHLGFEHLPVLTRDDVSWAGAPDEPLTVEPPARNPYMADNATLFALPASSLLRIRPLDTRRAHVVLAEVLVPGPPPAVYVLGYHGDSQQWFITDAGAPWAVVATRLESVLMYVLV